MQTYFCRTQAAFLDSRGSKWHRRWPESRQRAVIDVVHFIWTALKDEEICKFGRLNLLEPTKTASHKISFQMFIVIDRLPFVLLSSISFVLAFGDALIWATAFLTGEEATIGIILFSHRCYSSSSTSVGKIVLRVVVVLDMVAQLLMSKTTATWFDLMIIAHLITIFTPEAAAGSWGTTATRGGGGRQWHCLYTGTGLVTNTVVSCFFW